MMGPIQVATADAGSKVSDATDLTGPTGNCLELLTGTLIT